MRPQIDHHNGGGFGTMKVALEKWRADQKQTDALQLDRLRYNKIVKSLGIAAMAVFSGIAITKVFFNRTK